MFTDSVGQEFSQGTCKDWTPKYLGLSNRTRRLSWGAESARGSLTHFSGSWRWPVSKTYLPVASAHGWVPGKNTWRKRGWSKGHVLLRTWPQKLQNITPPIVCWLEQLQALPGSRAVEIHYISWRGMAMFWNSIWDRKYSCGKFCKTPSATLTNSNYFHQRNKMYIKILSENAKAWCATNLQSPSTKCTS